MSPVSRISHLKSRAKMMGMCRQFFAERDVMEVDCPCLSDRASIDAHIDLMSVNYLQKETYFLHSSPEYGMKRLLAEGIGDIYQLSHVFRDGECGKLHNPEFSMIEWYRIGFSFEEMIKETCALIQLFITPVKIEMISYREAFKKYAGIDYVVANEEKLISLIPKSYQEVETKNDLLDVILTEMIEPQFRSDHLTVLTHYPATQAALAKTVQKGDESVAERFEIFFNGLELANGYHELTDAKEQKKRFEENNQERIALGKKNLPADTRFLEALKKGIPECSGVAVGFDRLMMLKHSAKTIEEVIPFAWNKA